MCSSEDDPSNIMAHPMPRPPTGEELNRLLAHLDETLITDLQIHGDVNHYYTGRNPDRMGCANTKEHIQIEVMMQHLDWIKATLKEAIHG